MENEIKFFDTPSLYLAGAVTVTLHRDPVYIRPGKKILFRFPASDILSEIINKYSSGALQVRAIEYAEVLKRLRGEMFSKQAAENGNG